MIGWELIAELNFPWLKMVPKMNRNVSPKILKLLKALLLLNNFPIKPIIKLIQLAAAIMDTIQVIQTFINTSWKIKLYSSKTFPLLRLHIYIFEWGIVLQLLRCFGRELEKINNLSVSKSIVLFQTTVFNRLRVSTVWNSYGTLLKNAIGYPLYPLTLMENISNMP